MSLKKTAFRGIRWTTAAMIVVTVGSLVQLYILVRYIDESDFGLMALVNVVIAFALTFLDFGVSNGIIHKKDISSTQLSTLYWLTVLMGGLLTIAIYLLSPFIANIYEERELEYLLKLIALIFFINSFGHPFKVLLNKRLQFARLSLLTILSFVISFTTVVYLAVRGFGVYALVYGLMIRTLAETLIAGGMGWKEYQLRLVFKFRQIGFFVRFGSFQMGEGLLNFFSRQFDTLLIGKILGTEVLGVYDVIKRFVMRPFQTINPIITGVSFPLMSTIQDEEKRLSEVYLKQLNYLCTINFPVYAFLFFHAADIIVFMFGPEWLPYQAVFQMLTVTFAIISTGNPVGSLLLAKGRADLGFYWNAALFLLTPLLIFFSAYYGLEGIALALMLFQTFLIIPNFYLLVRRLIRVEAGQYFLQLAIPLLLALLMGVGTFGLSQLLDIHLLLRLAVLFVAGSLSYLIMSFYANRAFIHDFFLLLKP